MKLQTDLRRLACLSLALLGACSSSASTASDAASVDAAVMDALSLDATPQDAAMGSDTLDATLEDSSALDAALDATVADAGPADAASLDALGEDAGESAACDPSRVRFNAGGTLEVGQLCDDVIACAATESDATAIAAASSFFVCEAGAAAPCRTPYRCTYRNPGGPSTLDAAELEEVCKVTVSAPGPLVYCMIYL